MADLEANKAVVRRGFEQVWRGDLSLVADDYVDHNLPAGLTGRSGLAVLHQVTVAAFPDFSVTVEDVIAEGDKVAARVTNRGTNTGSFLGQPPTGRTAEWTTVAIFRVADGLLVERWGAIDAMALFAQLGFGVSGPPAEG